MCFYAIESHIVFMVMNMKRKKHMRRRRFELKSKRVFSVPILCMAICYLVGFALGSRFGLTSKIPGSIFSIMTESPASDENGFLAIFGSYGFYGFIFLLLSTTYLGFLLVPPVFALKGFLIGTLFLTYLQSEQSHVYLLAGISLCLPEIFVLPALLLVHASFVSVALQSSRCSFVWRRGAA